jgi:SAM-dependent methyltransferase
MAADDNYADELERLSRHYTETYLPRNDWATLKGYPYLCHRQKLRRIREALIECGLDSPERMRGVDVLDVGSGDGGTLAWLVELGASPKRLVGVDLVGERVERARSKFANVRFMAGDFVALDVGGPFDVVLLIAVLSSVLDDGLRRAIVDKCLGALRPGGALIFYDVIADEQLGATDAWRPLTFAEMGGYLGRLRPRYWRRDYLSKRAAERLLPKVGLAGAELVQAVGLFNMDATFGYVRT